MRVSTGHGHTSFQDEEASEQDCAVRESAGLNPGGIQRSRQPSAMSCAGVGTAACALVEPAIDSSDGSLLPTEEIASASALSSTSLSNGESQLGCEVINQQGEDAGSKADAKPAEAMTSTRTRTSTSTSNATGCCGDGVVDLSGSDPSSVPPEQCTSMQSIISDTSMLMTSICAVGNSPSLMASEQSAVIPVEIEAPVQPDHSIFTTSDCPSSGPSSPVATTLHQSCLNPLYSGHTSPSSVREPSSGQMTQLVGTAASHDEDHQRLEIGKTSLYLPEVTSMKHGTTALDDIMTASADDLNMHLFADVTPRAANSSSNLESMNLPLAEWKDQNSHLLERVRVLEAQLSKSGTANSEYCRANDDLVNELAQVQSRESGHLETLEQLTAQLGASQCCKATAQETIEHLRYELAQKDAEMAKMQAQLSDQALAIEALEDQVYELVKEQSELASQRGCCSNTASVQTVGAGAANHLSQQAQKLEATLMVLCSDSRKDLQGFRALVLEMLAAGLPQEHSGAAGPADDMGAQQQSHHERGYDICQMENCLSNLLQEMIQDPAGVMKVSVLHVALGINGCMWAV